MSTCPELPCQRADIARHLGDLSGRMAQASVQRHLRGIRAFLNWCQEVHDIPIPSLRRMVGAVPKKPHEALTVDECRRLLANLEGQDRLMVRVLLSTGMRAGELAGISWVDILAQGVAVIGKTGPKIYPLGEGLRAELLAHQRRIESPTAAIFRNAHGGPLSVPSIYRRVSQALKNAKIVKKKMGPHILRHTAATLVQRSSGDLRFTQELLGHSNISMTARYAGMDSERVQELHKEHDPLNMIEGVTDGKEGPEGPGPTGRENVSGRGRKPGNNRKGKRTTRGQRDGSRKNPPGR